jgi:peptide/nickel transport system substrate-binding protein
VAAQTPKRGGMLTFAVTAEALSTDCHAITTYAAVHVLAPHYSLLKIDPDNYPKLKPDVAGSWSVSPTARAHKSAARDRRPLITRRAEPHVKLH